MVAALWPVNDRSTAVLIAEFYRLLLAEQQDPATALESARGHLRHATARKLAEWFERRYHDSAGTDPAALPLPKTSYVQLMPHVGTHEALHRAGRVVVY